MRHEPLFLSSRTPRSSPLAHRGAVTFRGRTISRFWQFHFRAAALQVSCFLWFTMSAAAFRARSRIRCRSSGAFIEAALLAAALIEMLFSGG